MDKLKGLGMSVVSINQALELAKKAYQAIAGTVRELTDAYGKQEQAEINELNEERDRVIDEYGVGDIGRGSGED